MCGYQPRMSNIAELIAPPGSTSLPEGRPLTGRPNTDHGPIPALLGAVRAHFDMDVAFISRQIGTTHRVFSHVAAKGSAPLCEGDTNQNDNSICWLVIEGRLPQRICDTREYELARNLPVTEDLGVRSHFSVPLLRKDGSVHGSLCCFSHRPRPEITERDMEVLRSAATLASDHIESRLELEERQQLADDKLDHVLSSENLFIVHQPILQIAGRELIGHECLLRFGNCIESSPASLFSDALIAGKSFELEMLAAQQALATLEKAQPSRFISINVSPQTLVSEEFWSLLPDGMNDKLVIEITEQQAIADYDAVKAAIERVKQKSWVAIDDVGAGFACLRHLVHLEADILKMDREFVEGVCDDPARRALTTALVQFARETEATLIAEGVETMRDLNTLKSLGVEYAQGFLLGRPARPHNARFAC